MRTRKMRRAIVLLIALAVGGAVELGAPRPARAIIGLPFTPLSYAGVARRTTRRAMLYGAAVAPPVVAPPVVAAPVVAPPVVAAPVVTAPVVARPVVIW